MSTTFSRWGTRIVRYIELDYVYAGWSVAVLEDGRLANRWEDARDQFPERFEATQEWISAQMAKDWASTGVAA